jgi:hypothetical protein
MVQALLKKEGYETHIEPIGRILDPEEKTLVIYPTA